MLRSHSAVDPLRHTVRVRVDGLRVAGDVGQQRHVAREAARGQRQDLDALLPNGAGQRRRIRAAGAARRGLVPAVFA